MRLTIIRIKPNPAGKDRPAHGSPAPSQLAGEWADFRNDAGQDVALDGITLWHLAYAPGRQPEWEKVTGFNGTLPAGKIVRVHAGERRAVSVIRSEDVSGADYHLFTGRDAYVWNNKQGDSPLLYQDADKKTIDRASYAPNPPEGVVLVRPGDALVAAVARAANW
jgi:hypothetical protein